MDSSTYDGQTATPPPPTTDFRTATTTRVPTATPADLSAQDTACVNNLLSADEKIVFATRAHPVIFIRPIISSILWALGIKYAVDYRIHPIINGHHADLHFYATFPGAAVIYILSYLLVGLDIRNTQRRKVFS